MASDINNPVNSDFVGSNYNEINNSFLGSNSGVDNGSYFGQGAVDWATKGVPLSVVSGVGQIWNSVGYVGNAVSNLGSEDKTPFENKMDVNDIANNFDDEGTYGQYYQKHKSGIDLGGFVLGSIVPSGLAIKGLRMAQSGAAVTSSMGRASGLLTNTSERYFLNKAAQITAGGAGNPLLYRVGAAGAFGVQMTLEGVAASTATYATMFQSPMYEDLKDAGDVVSSILVGGALFGGLGGVYRGTIGFKRALFPLAGSETAITSPLIAGPIKPQVVYTNINQLERVAGASIFEAAFTPIADDLVGSTLKGFKTDSTAINNLTADAKYALDIGNRQSDLAKGINIVDDYGNVINAATPEHYLYTQGDQLARQINLRANTTRELDEVLSNLKPSYGGQFVDTLAQRTAQIRATKVAELEALESTLYTKLAAGGSPDVAAAFKGMIDALVAKGSSAEINQLLNGAVAIGRVSKSTADDVRKRVVNLATGEHDKAAVYTLGDLGVVKAVSNSQKVVLVDGRQVKLGEAMTYEGMKTAPAHIVQARFFAESEFLKAAKDITETTLSKYKVADWDIPKMEASILKFGKYMDENGVVHDGATALGNLAKSKASLREDLSLLPEANIPDITTRLNVSSAYFNNAASGKTTEGLMQGIDTTALRHATVEFATESRVPNAFEVRAAASNELKVRVYQQYNEQLLPGIMGAKANLLPTIDLSKYDGVDTLAGIITQANSRYGSQASKMQYAGQLTQVMQLEMATAREVKFLLDKRELSKFAAGSPEATELATIEYLVQSAERKLALGKDGFIYKVDDLKLVDDGKLLPTELVAVSEIKSAAVAKYMQTHVSYEGSILVRKNMARRGVGRAGIPRYSSALGEELYFAPPHPDDLVHKVLIQDPTNGNVGMLWAADKGDLAKKVQLVSEANPTWQIRTPEQIDSFKKLQGVYEDALSLRGFTKIDNDLKKQGIMADVAPTTNMADILANHQRNFARAERTLLNAGLLMKYGQPLAEAYHAARVVGRDDIGLKKIFNTIFNIQNTDNTWHQFSQGLERVIDRSGGQAWSMLKDAMPSIKKGSISFSQVEAKAFADADGISLYGSDALWQLSKASSFNGFTQNKVRELNSAMRFLVLGIDYFNGLVNMIGTPVLAIPEIKAAFAAGQDVPWAKILGAGMKDLFRGEGRRADLQRYADIGVINKNMFLYHDVLDSHALMMGSDTSAAALARAGDLKSKLERVLNVMQTPTAYAEQTTQLFAAKIADKIGQARGLTGEDLNAFISTMQKKIIANYTSAQRPLVFQGVTGQAVGLFQTYNFNLFQQAARHLAEGNNKSIAVMAALQGTLFGAQSLPGFNVMNQAVGAYGGDEKTDIYTGVRNLLGEEAGNSLIYGNLSTMLGSNLWTRGNANPRNITVLPINPADLAQVQYYSRAIGGVAEWVNSISKGGNFAVSGYEAIAHANISRPLTGLAEIAMGGRTTNQGNLETAVNTDLLSTATAIRLMGGRPMAEALSQEASYKFGLVQAKEQAAIKDLGYALRTEMISERGSVDSKVVSDFAKKYAESGGNPQGFRKWYLNNLAKATTPRAQLFAERIKNDPWAKTYQELAAPDEQMPLE